MMTGSASFSAATACSRLPAAIASSTLRTKVRMRERRPLLISVRRAITRAAFLADFVFAILGSITARERFDPRDAYTIIMNKKRRRAVSPPVPAYRCPAGAGQPEHDPEKWVLVFGKDHAPTIAQFTPRVLPARDRGRPRPASGRRPSRRSAAASRAPRRGRHGYARAAP